MKRRYWYFASGLVIVLLLIEFDMAHRYSLINKNSTFAINNLKSKNQLNHNANHLNANESIKNLESNTTSKENQFDSEFKAESRNIAELQDNPQAVEIKMNQMAQSMKSEEIRQLASVIKNKNQEGDQRAMAVELLSRNNSLDALNTLSDFVVESSEGLRPDSNDKEFESVLKAQAIEGISTYPQKDIALNYLNQLAQKVDESFLKDRIFRSRENLLGRAPAVNEQDEKALKQFVE